MIKKVNSKVGPLVVWSDFIKPRYNRKTDTVDYLTSDEAQKGFSQRYIAVHMTHQKDVYIAVAVNKKQDKEGPETNTDWWKYILENRISSLVYNKGNMSPEDKGMTMIPYNYLETVMSDKAVYQNIYGEINLDTFYSSVDLLSAEVDRVVNSIYDSRRTRETTG